MDNFKFRLIPAIIILQSLLNTCFCQQNALFNQLPFQNRQQTQQLRQQLQQQQQQRQQPFSPLNTLAPLPSLNPLNSIQPIIPQTPYRNYNQVNQQNYVPITAYQNELNYDGSFSYGYASADGTTAQAQGFIKNLGLGEAVEAQVVQGSYSYTSPEGTPITVRYIADENGFRAEGAHIPTPPPIPPALAPSLLAPPFQQVLNPNLNPYQTPYRQFPGAQNLQPDQRLTSLQLQQQRIYQQQQQKVGQYQPNTYQSENQFGGSGIFGGLPNQFGTQFSGFGLKTNYGQQQQSPFQQSLQNNQQNLTLQNQQQQQQQQQQATQLQNQQQNIQQQQQQQQQQLATQELRNRPNQLVNPFGFNQYRRYKKATTLNKIK